MGSDHTTPDVWKTVADVEDVPDFMAKSPTALDHALILPIDFAEAEEAQRKLLSGRIARVLENLDLIQQVAERLHITTNEVRRRYSDAMESLLDLVPVKEGEVSAVLKIVHIAEDDGDAQMTVLRPKRERKART